MVIVDSILLQNVNPMDLRKACLYIASDGQGINNYPFECGPEGEGFKNLLFPFVHLREALSEFGIDLSTRDINTAEESYLLFSWDNPDAIKAEKSEGQVWCLLINDPPVYVPTSWDKRYHTEFDYIFTYDETLVDNEKYFYYPIAVDTNYFSIPELITEDEFSKRALATTVNNAIHKYQDPKHPNCNHFRRYNTIKWYGENHPEDFRFYGGTFLKRDYYLGFRGLRFAKKTIPPRIFSSFARFVQRDLIGVFGGELAPLGKFDVIRNYNFYYCYENTSGINGYLSEKLFDCLYSGIVPIYWGAPNVKQLVPFDCFIDGREFVDEASLYEFISGMRYATYRKYLEEAGSFLMSEAMERFTVKNATRCLLAPLRSAIQ